MRHKGETKGISMRTRSNERIVGYVKTRIWFADLVLVLGFGMDRRAVEHPFGHKSLSDHAAGRRW